MIKKILLGFIVVVLVVGSIIMASSIRDAKQEDLLKEEVKSVMALFRSSDFDQEKMDELLERTVSKKDYEVVEKAFKAYIKDYLYDLNYYKIKQVLNDERVYNILSVNNYASDGKSFNLSRAFLNETITFLKEAEAKFDTYTSEEKIMSYLKEDELQNYYLNLYKSLIDSNINNNEDNVNFGANLHKIIEILTNTQDIINLLKNNADAWRIENKEIIFSSESVMNDYNEILAKLKSIS